LGGSVKFILSGSAPLDPALAEWLKIVFCCDVLEGYGLTENLAAAFITELNENKFGRVGKPLSCLEVKLVDVTEMKYVSSNNPPTGEGILVFSFVIFIVSLFLYCDCHFICYFIVICGLFFFLK